MNIVTRGLVLSMILFAPALFAAPQTRTLTVRDDTGDKLTVDPAGCRIVSLAPGTTAMLFAAGAGPCIIGTIAHSNEPAPPRAGVGDVETLDFERLWRYSLRWWWSP